MQNEAQKRVFDFLSAEQRPVSVPDIKKGLNIQEPNVVESAVLRGLRAGELELTPTGIKTIHS